MIISLYKLLGSLCISASSYLLIRNYEASLSTSLILCKDALSFVTHAKNSIFYKELPVSAIFATFDTKYPPTEIFYKIASKDSKKENILSAMPQYEPKTLEIMTLFYSELGHSYRDPQITMCERTEKLLAERINSLETETSSKKSVFRASVLFFSAAAILILI